MPRPVEVYLETVIPDDGSGHDAGFPLQVNRKLTHVSIITTSNPAVAGSVRAWATLTDGQVTGRVLGGGTVATPTLASFAWTGEAYYNKFDKLNVTVFNRSGADVTVAVAAVYEEI